MADSARRANLAIRHRRAESAFSADSARRANVPVAGVKKAGGDATENDDFQIGKQPLQGTIFLKFDGGDLMKILFLQMKRYSEFARLCFRSERVFVMGGDPTKNCNFHRGKVGLLWSKNLNLVCRENCFANRDCSPNPPFPLHLMKCQPQCSAANSYFVPQQSMSTVTR